MIFSQERGDLRDHFFTSWQKHNDGLPLEPLEKQIVGVILEHPEYHKVFDDRDRYYDKDYSAEMGETNPFLHLSLHISLIEQITTDRPDGIRKLYQQAVKQNAGDHHGVEHAMMDALIEQMWQMQQNGTPPDDATYLKKLKKEMKKLFFR